MRRSFGLVLVVGSLLALAACGGGKKAAQSTPSSSAAGGVSAPSASAPAAGNSITVSLGETDASHMYLRLSSSTATAGKVTFQVTNSGNRKHEFVVLKTDTPAANFLIGTFEGTPDRIDEDTAGTNVGETGDLDAGQSKTLTISMTAGHYALLCNLQGHYRMGMRQDFTVS